MRSFPGAQLKESHGGGDPSWDGIQELLGAPAGLDEVQEPEASLNRAFSLGRHQDSTSAVEASFCRRVENAMLREGGLAGVFWG